MFFNAELVGIKTLSDGALRVTFDIPEIDQPKVLSEISQFRGVALQVDCEQSNNMTIIKNLRKEAHLVISNYASIKGIEYQIMHDKILSSEKMFPGKSYISLKQLSIPELKRLIESIKIGG